MFKKAQRTRQKLRLAIEGPSGSGKSYSALLVARGLVGPTGKIAVLDSENGSASLYDHLTDYDTAVIEAPFSPERYITMVHEAEKAGYDCLVIDSITHEWSGPGGCVDINDQYGGRFQDWAKTTPRHNKFIAAMMESPIHIIVTMRSKESYSQTQDDRGKQKIEKQGEAPQQRQGISYEFTTVLTINVKHLADSSKDRTGLFPKDILFTPSVETGEAIRTWLESGKADVPPPSPTFTTYDLDAVAATFGACRTMDDVKREWLAIYKPGHPQLVLLTAIKDAAKKRLEFVGDSPKTESTPDTETPATKGQITALQAHYSSIFTKEQREERLAAVSEIVGRKISSFNALSKADAHLLLESIKEEVPA